MILCSTIQKIVLFFRQDNRSGQKIRYDSSDTTTTESDPLTFHALLKTTAYLTPTITCASNLVKIHFWYEVSEIPLNTELYLVLYLETTLFYIKETTYNVKCGV